MYAVLTSLRVMKTGFMAYLFSRKLEIQIKDRTLRLPAANAVLSYAFPCTQRFTISVSVDGKSISKLLRFAAKETVLSFSFKDVVVELTLDLVSDAWAKLDPTIDGFGVYQGRRYYVESSTLETSYEDVFSESKQFPSFHKLAVGQETLYADSINKVVIRSNPKTRRASILGKLRLFLRSIVVGGSLVPHKIFIDRNSLFDSAWYSYLPAFMTRGFYEILISFKDEIGEDQGGLKREFLYLLFNELVKDNRIDKSDVVYDVNAAIACPEFIYCYTNRKEQIDVLDDMLANRTTADYYVIFGVVVASLFLLSEALQFNFSLIFYENILQRCFTLRHVQDPELQKNLHSSLSTAEANGYVYDRLFEPKKNHYDHIRFGFDLVLDSISFENATTKKPAETSASQRLAERFTAFDFPFLFYHFEPLSADKLRSVVEYVNCDSRTVEIQWLWEVLGSKDQMFISKLLQFITGSGNLPNLMNGSAFTIEKRGGRNELFRSSACIKRLYMGSFDSLACLRENLEVSVMSAEGFHFV